MKSLFRNFLTLIAACGAVLKGPAPTYQHNSQPRGSGIPREAFSRAAQRSSRRAKGFTRKSLQREHVVRAYHRSNLDPRNLAHLHPRHLRTVSSSL